MNHNIAVTVPLTRGQSFTLRELADVYMVAYRGSGPGQGQRLQFFVGILGDKIASEIDGDDVQDALDALAARGCLLNRGGKTREAVDIVRTMRPLAPATINRYRSTLQAVLTWAQKRRLMPRGWANPVKETELLPVDNSRIRFLSEEEYQRLLLASKVSYWKMLHVLIKMAVTTGARRGTLLGLRWRDIDLEAGQAFAERTKNGEPFVMVLQEDVVHELRRLRGGARADELVFQGRNPYKPMEIDKAFKNALDKARLEGVVFHTLRHTHASWLARKGVPLLAIADSLNHKSLAMTKRYAHLCVDSRAEMLSKVFGNTAA